MRVINYMRLRIANSIWKNSKFSSKGLAKHKNKVQRLIDTYGEKPVNAVLEAMLEWADRNHKTEAAKVFLKYPKVTNALMNLNKGLPNKLWRGFCDKEDKLTSGKWTLKPNPIPSSWSGSKGYAKDFTACLRGIGWLLSAPSGDLKRSGVVVWRKSPRWVGEVIGSENVGREDEIGILLKKPVKVLVEWV